MDKNTLTALVKEKCLSLGFSKSGITKVQYHQEDREHLDAWIGDNYHASMQWMENNIEKRTNISNYYNESKSVICVALNYFTGTVTDNYNEPYISNYALGKDYHIIIKSKLKNLLDEIKKIHDWLEKNTKSVE